MIYVVDIDWGKYAGIAQWETPCRNRRLSIGWGICAEQKYISTSCWSNLSANKSAYNYHNVSPDFAVDIVKASVFLQKFSRERDGYKFQDALAVPGLEDVPDG